MAAGPGTGRATGHLRVATYNVHCGVDGWGRPFDVVAECGALDADVLVLQECWTPDDGQPGVAERVANHLGLERHEKALAHGWLAGPDPRASLRWGPGIGHRHDTLRLDGARPSLPGPSPGRTVTEGRWGLAVLTRVPTSDRAVIDLGRLSRDPATRLALRVTVTVEGEPLVVVGTHLSHLLQGSPVQYRRLRAALPSLDRAGVVCGDMNLWGPAVTALLPGWRRAVRGRTWPSARPHSQLDHLLVTGPVSVVSSGVAPSSGSDHRPVHAVLAVGRRIGGTVTADSR